MSNFHPFGWPPQNGPGPSWKSNDQKDKGHFHLSQNFHRNRRQTHSSSSSEISSRTSRCGRPSGKQNKNFEQDQKDLLADYLEDVKLCKLEPATVERYEPDVIDLELIELDLPDEDLKLPEASRNLRELLRKCTKLRRFDIIPFPMADELLQQTSHEMPQIRTGMKTEVMIVPKFQDPPTFFAHLKAQTDRLNLINFMLTDLLQHEKLELNGLYEGQKVAVDMRSESESEIGFVCRGEVFKVHSDELIEVYLTDFGYRVGAQPERLKELPEFLRHIPSVGFRACFSDLIEWTGTDHIEDLLAIWKCELEMSKEFVCTIDGENSSPVGPIYQVTLFKKINDDVHENVADHLGAENKKRELPTSYVRASCRKDERHLHSNFEVDIPQYRSDGHSTIKRVAAVQIISPEELTLIYISGDGRLPKWYEEMQEFYDDKDRYKSYLVREKRLVPNRCYVAYDPDTRTWNRIRLLGLFQMHKAIVWFVDRGDIKHIEKNLMKEIHPQFCQSVALSFRAHVAHVKPPKESEWSPEAIQLIRRMFHERADEDLPQELAPLSKLVDAVFVETVELEVNRQNPYANSAGLILMDRDSEKKSLALAGQLVQMGLARCTGPWSARNDLAYYLKIPPYYDQRDMNNYLKHSASWLVNDLDTHLDKPKKKKKEVLPMSLLSSPPTRHVMPESVRQKLCSVTISHEGTGPSCFYIQMENKTKELESMMSDLDAIGPNMSCLGFRDMTAGTLVLALPSYRSDFQAWGRAIVLRCNFSAGTVVMFIDYGFTSIAREVRKMPKYFDCIPPFCRRVHLDPWEGETRLMPVGLQWSKDAEKSWKQIVQYHKRFNSVLYAWQCQESVVEVDGIDQALMFTRNNDRGSNWKCSEQPVDYSVNEDEWMQDCPTLKPFLTSIGVNVVYEKEGCGSNVKLVPIWKPLDDQKLLIPTNIKTNPFQGPVN